jgi:D-alanyl-D-alanine carboxypeptidase
MDSKFDRSLVLVLICTIILGSLYFYGSAQVQARQIAFDQKISQFQNPFSNLTLGAKSATVIDMKTGQEIYMHHSSKILPLASITKLMSAMIIMETRELEESVIINKKALDVDGNNNLILGEKWNIVDLLKFSVLVSSNDGIVAISDDAPEFITKMNDKAKEFGLSSIYFANSTGLDIGEEDANLEDLQPAATGHVRDAVQLLWKSYKEIPEIIEPTTHTEVLFNSIDGFSHPAENTNEAVEKLPTILASKTGYTDLSGGNLVVIVRTSGGRELGIGVLGSTLHGRFDDIVNLKNAGEQYFNSLNSLGLLPYFPFK